MLVLIVSIVVVRMICQFAWVFSTCATLSDIPQATHQITRRTPCILARGGFTVRDYVCYRHVIRKEETSKWKLIL